MTHLSQWHLDWSLIGLAATPASVLTLAVCLLLVARSIARQRDSARSDLARIFEQLDLLQLDRQRPADHPSAPVARADVHGDGGDCRGGGGDYNAAAQLAARGGTAVEIAERCGIVKGEARVLIALQQARARRTEAA